MRPIILASASPRRRTLLHQLIGNTFTVEESDFEEGSLSKVPDSTSDLSVHDHVLASSRGKARDVADRHTSGVVIGADTVVVCEGQILGKPHTPGRAVEMLQFISGKTVDVITGITVIDIEAGEEIGDEGGNEREQQANETTKVFISDLDDNVIRDYVATGEPLDKAGAFGIQGKGAILVERIEGDYFNVVGLPLFSLAGLLRQVGVDVFRPDEEISPQPVRVIVPEYD